MVRAKEPQLAPPNAVLNLVNRASFGAFNGTRSSFSDIGTARMHHLLVGRFVFWTHQPTLLDS